MVIWVVWGSFATHAGVPIALPPGVEPGPWMTPLQLAGLELSTVRPPVLQMVDTGSRWALTTPNGRTVYVPSPTTATAREEIAFLARSLVRDLDTAPTPIQPEGDPPPFALPPPPPPPQRPPPRRAPRPAPAPEPPAAPIVLLPPQSQQPLEESVEAPVVVDLEPEVRPPPRPRAALSSAPAWIFSGVSARPGTLPAPIIGLGTEVYATPQFHVDLELSWTVGRRFDFDRNRTMSSVDGEISGSIPVIGPVSLGIGAGLSVRYYRQDNLLVEQILAARIGPRADWRVVRLGPLGLFLAAQGQVDLGSTQLDVPGGALRTLSPVEAQGVVELRFLGSGDLFFPSSTSSR